MSRPIVSSNSQSQLRNNEAYLKEQPGKNSSLWTLVDLREVNSEVNDKFSESTNYDSVDNRRSLIDEDEQISFAERGFVPEEAVEDTVEAEEPVFKKRKMAGKIRRK